ncbi:MAG: biopolymer transporter ExbD [Prevotella sp.]|nr:biopolymer transporter ExbD [Prevotella sp.]
MFQRRKKKVPGLNTTSTADISFMLLIFFLVTSSMDTDKGLPRQLPPPEESQTEQELLVKERNVLALVLDADDRLTCNGDTLTPEALTDRVADFVENKADDAALPEKSERDVNLLGRCRVSDRHIITIQTDARTTYDAYFQMQNAIVAGYNRLRNQLARQRFGRPYARCTIEQREAIAMVFPQRISEMAPTGQTKEGGQP